MATLFFGLSRLAPRTSTARDLTKQRCSAWCSEYFVGAGSQQQDEGDVEGQRKRLRGIVTGHAYSVLQVHEAEGPLRLIELRAQPKPRTRLQL